MSVFAALFEFLDAKLYSLLRLFSNEKCENQLLGNRKLCMLSQKLKNQYLTIFARKTGRASTFVTIDLVDTGTAVLTGAFNLGTLVDVQLTQVTFKTRGTSAFEPARSVLKDFLEHVPSTQYLLQWQEVLNFQQSAAVMPG